MKTELKYWCNTCKEKVDVINEIIETSKKGMPMLKANCKDCGRHLSVFLPKSYLNQAEPYTPIETKEIPIEDEEEKIEKFRKDVENNKLLKKNGIETIDTKKEKPIKKTYYDLFKYFLIILGVGILVISYLIYSGYLNDEIDLICGNSTQICNMTYENTGCNVNLSCDCPSFPSDLEIKLINVTGG